MLLNVVQVQVQKTELTKTYNKEGCLASLPLYFINYGLTSDALKKLRLLFVNVNTFTCYFVAD